MTKRSKREKEALDEIIEQLDLNGITRDELFGDGGLVLTLRTTATLA
jgi:hypothetical protein